MVKEVKVVEPSQEVLPMSAELILATDRPGSRAPRQLNQLNECWSGSVTRH